MQKMRTAALVLCLLIAGCAGTAVTGGNAPPGGSVMTRVCVPLPPDKSC
jgi:hypothetical protein